MEDFLKNRSSHQPASAQTESATAGSAPSAGPFAVLHREPSAGSPKGGDVGRAQPAGATKPGACQVAGIGASVQTIMERGRVTKLIVTCSCGKVTELACTY